MTRRQIVRARRSKKSDEANQLHGLPPMLTPTPVNVGERLLCPLFDPHQEHHRRSMIEVLLLMDFLLARLLCPQCGATSQCPGAVLLLPPQRFQRPLELEAILQ